MTDSDLSQLVEGAYLSLLKLPYGSDRRFRLQSVLASLRDEISRVEGIPAELVQNEFEARAVSA